MTTRVIVTLTPREKELYDIIVSADNWISRSQIAQIEGKRQLSPHDFDLLRRLEEKKLISQSPSGLQSVGNSRRRRKEAFVYMAIPPVDGE